MKYQINAAISAKPSKKMAHTLDESSPKQSAKRAGLVPSIEAHRRDTTG